MPADVATLAAPDLVGLIVDGHLRLGHLARRGQLDTDEARELTVARHWLQRRRSDAWRIVYPDHRAPIPPPIALPIGELTPPEHLAAIGGQAAAEQAFGMADAFRLVLCAELYGRDGPAGPWAREYAAKWTELQAGIRQGVNPSGATGRRSPYKTARPPKTETSKR